MTFRSLAAVAILAVSASSIAVSAAPNRPGRVGIRSAAAPLPHPDPKAIENGRETVLDPFPANPAGYEPYGLAFTPDGTAFFFNGASDEVDRLSPNGSYAKIPVPGALISHALIYANGYIWMAAKNGIERILPDGSRRNHYFFGKDGMEIARGASGAVFAVASYQSGNHPAVSDIYRVNRDGTVTTIARNQEYLGNLVAGSDGSMYVAYNTATSSGDFSGIFRINLDGTLSTILTIPYTAGTSPTNPGTPDIALDSLAFSQGNLYFQERYDSGYAPNGLARLDPSGTLTQTPFPPALQNVAEYDTAVDKGGNLWLNLDPYPSDRKSPLVEFDVRRSLFYNPIFPGSADLPYYFPLDGYIFVGPDDNIWWLWRGHGAQAALVSYVRKVQTLTPTGLTLAPGSVATFSISETQYGGPWTAQSLNPSIATVSPASSTTGTFNTTGVGHGTTSIAVTDRLGNVSYESIAVP